MFASADAGYVVRVSFSVDVVVGLWYDVSAVSVGESG
jgi:hypothetical protein